jgi:hypothetical protein
VEVDSGAGVDEAVGAGAGACSEVWAMAGTEAKPTAAAARMKILVILLIPLIEGHGG